MVSTRQMSTSGGNGGNGTLNNHNASAAAAVASATIDSARLTAMATTQTQRGNGGCGASGGNMALTAAPIMSAAAAAATILATADATTAAASASTSRECAHTQTQQQLVKLDNNTCNTRSDGRRAAQSLQLFDLPVEILAKIFAYAGYRKVGQLRVISRRMNDVCMDILNSTFSRLITQTYNRFHAIKANMPRRESARRNHPLACECDIIETCYMRLSLLQMTFGKHIERGHCCFFPGAILDEVYNILNYIRNTPRLERPYRVTDELFDLSTMAMEYFRDRIEQTLPDIAYFNKDFFKLPTNIKRPALVTSVDHAESASSSPPQSNMVLRKGIRKIKQGMKIYNNQLSVLRNELRSCKRKSSEQAKQISEQQKIVAEQQKQTLEYANRLDENDKKNEEMARKFSTLLQELNKCKTELQYWRSKSPAIPICTSCGQKLAPLLPPPEDFQALINQGVKPEDIILNLSDDAELENDANVSANNDAAATITTTTAMSTQTTQTSQVFAFPDKETTAKLLAVSNTLNKNQLKRQYCSSNNSTTASTSTSAALAASNRNNEACNDCYSNSAFYNCASASTSASSNSHGGVAGCCNCRQLHAGNAVGVGGDNHGGGGGGGGDAKAETGNENYKINQPSEMTNRLSYLRGSNIIRTTASATSTSNTGYNQLTDHKQCGGVGGGVLGNGEPNGAAAGGVKEDGSRLKVTGGGGGGNGGGGVVIGLRSHRSVIVSTAMLQTANRANTIDVAAATTATVHGVVAAEQSNNNSTTTSLLQAGTDGGGGAASNNKHLVGGSVGGGGGGVSGVAGAVANGGEEMAVEHVANLQGVTSHETKKARRVQKATRCLNGSGKRSKS